MPSNLVLGARLDAAEAARREAGPSASTIARFAQEAADEYLGVSYLNRPRCPVCFCAIAPALTACDCRS